MKHCEILGLNVSFCHSPKDFARLLQEQQKEPLNLVWVAYYWQQVVSFSSSPTIQALKCGCDNQMLQAVHVSMKRRSCIQISSQRTSFLSVDNSSLSTLGLQMP